MHREEWEVIYEVKQAFRSVREVDRYRTLDENTFETLNILLLRIQSAQTDNHRVSIRASHI